MNTAILDNLERQSNSSDCVHHHKRCQQCYYPRWFFVDVEWTNDGSIAEPLSTEKKVMSAVFFFIFCSCLWVFSVEAQLESGSEIGDNHLSDIVLHMLLVIFNFVLDVFLICWILHFCQCWWIVLFVLGLWVQLWKLFGN